MARVLAHIGLQSSATDWPDLMADPHADLRRGERGFKIRISHIIFSFP
jgi:hypothetical protein